MAAFFPVAVFMIIIYRKDTEREPKSLLVKCFLGGCVITIPVVFVGLFLDGFNVFNSAAMSSFYDAFVVAATVEEGFKFLFLYLIIRKRNEFDQHFDGIVYAVFVSLGFAFVENVLYVAEYGFGTAVLRAVLAVPAHGLFGVCMGYFFAHAKFSPKYRTVLLFLSFLIPMLLHGLYDFLLMYLDAIDNDGVIVLLFLGFVALMICLWGIGIRFIRKQHAKDKPFANQQNL